MTAILARSPLSPTFRHPHHPLTTPTMSSNLHLSTSTNTKAIPASLPKLSTPTSTADSTWPPEFEKLLDGNDRVTWIPAESLGSGVGTKYKALNATVKDKGTDSGMGVTVTKIANAFSYGGPTEPTKYTPNTPPPNTSAVNHVLASSSPSAASSSNLYPQGITLKWPAQYSVQDPAAGLRNAGMTCFLNSVLQVWMHTPPLLQFLSQFQEATSEIQPMKRSKYSLTHALKLCAEYSWRKSTPCYSPTVIYGNLKVIAPELEFGEQEDSHEFLRQTMDYLQKETLQSHGASKVADSIKETTWIHRIWGGKLRSRVHCTSCKANSDTFDACLDLSLDIFRLGSVQDALTAFTKKEVLGGKNSYKCDKCKKLVNAEKQFKIVQAPKVLTIHLKRFRPGGGKNSQKINYDLNLKLGQAAVPGQDAEYDLFGVTCHQGSGPHFGHYYSFVKDRKGQWYKADDSSVTPAKPWNVTSHDKAYILHYIQKPGTQLNGYLHGEDVKSNKRARQSSSSNNTLVNGNGSSPSGLNNNSSSPSLSKSLNSAPPIVKSVNPAPIVPSSPLARPQPQVNAEAGPSRLPPTPPTTAASSSQYDTSTLPTQFGRSNTSTTRKFAPVRDNRFYSGGLTDHHREEPESGEVVDREDYGHRMDQDDEGGQGARGGEDNESIFNPRPGPKFFQTQYRDATGNPNKRQRVEAKQNGSNKIQKTSNYTSPGNSSPYKNYGNQFGFKGRGGRGGRGSGGGRGRH